MPYRICKIFEVESGHLLSKHPLYCRFPHGHTRKIEMVLESDTLDEREMVCDFQRVRHAAADCIRALDHALCMNTEDPNYAALKKAFGERVLDFPGRDPTTEVIARRVYDSVAASLRGTRAEGAEAPLRRGVRLVSVRVWETSSSWAEYAPAATGGRTRRTGVME
jgi:6-pyruvoyltetrahydropterin/6-carboxytetrahydropterin synthase